MAGPKVEVEISAEIAEFKKNLKLAQGQLNEFATDAGKRLKSLGESIKSIAVPAGVGAAAIAGIGVAAVVSYGKLQSLEKGLAAVAGSTDAAKKQLDDLREVAKLPGLGLEEAVRGSIALQAIGISADEAKRAILQFGNAVATVGKGRAELDRALYGLQQLSNTDFPLGEDLNIIKDAIPQVSKLLTEAFGANRSDELAKMGITSKQVVETILTGLEQLPRVSGGVENAIENMQDGITEAWQEIGKAINESLDIEGVMNKVGDAIGGVVEWFRALDPKVRDAIVYIGAGTAAFLGLLAASGAIIAIAPVVGAAFAAMGGPITIAITALAVAGAYAIANWDKVKSFFSDSKVFKALGEELNGLWELIKSTFNAIKTFLIGVWETIRVPFLNQFNNIWNGIKDVLGNALSYITGSIKVFTGVLSGDWSKAWTGIKDMFGSIWNTIIDIMQFGLGTIGNGLSSLFRVLKLDGVAGGIESVTEKIEASMDKAKASISSSSLATKALTETIKGAVDASSDLVDGQNDVITVIDTVTGSAEKARIKINDLKDAIIAMNGVEFKPGGGTGEEAFRQLDRGITIPSGSVNIEGVIPDVIAAAKELADTFNEEAGFVLRDGLVDVFSGLGKAVGDAIANGGNALQAAGASLLAGLGNILVDLGKMAIKVGVGIEAIKVSLKTLNPFVAIAAGVALIAIGSAFAAGASRLSDSMGGGTAGQGSNQGTFTTGEVVRTSDIRGGDSQLFLRGSDIYIAGNRYQAQIGRS